MTQKRIIGDWIPMRANLARDPAVIQIASTLNIDPVMVVGTLHGFWSWASQQTADGVFTGITAKWIDAEFQLPGLTEALLAVGWLAATNAQDGCNLRIPHFDHYMSGSAKARLLARRRVQRFRNAHVTGARRPFGTRREGEEKSSKKNSIARKPSNEVIAIYDAYPRKVGRARALIAIENALGTIMAAELLAKVKAYAASVEHRRGTDEWRFVPHPATWFNGERWTDELEQQASKPAPARGASRVQSRPGKYDQT